MTDHDPPGVDATGEPRGTTVAPDGTRIAWFRSGSGSPIVLVHGATGDHTVWRTSGPLLAVRHAVYAVDRRGRGASGDTLPYAISREYEDIAAVVDAVAAVEGRLVDVVGHSFGGRVGLGAARLSANLRRLVVYEGAPATPEHAFHDEGLLERLTALAEAGERETLLAEFMTRVVGMTPDELAGFRSSDTWSRRAEAAPTILREMLAEASSAASTAACAEIGIPVLQILGGESPATFVEGTRALDHVLPDGRIAVLPGQRHAAHHTDSTAFVAAIEAFLGAP